MFTNRTISKLFERTIANGARASAKERMNKRNVSGMDERNASPAKKPRLSDTLDRSSTEPGFDRPINADDDDDDIPYTHSRSVSPGDESQVNSFDDSIQIVHYDDGSNSKNRGSGGVHSNTISKRSVGRNSVAETISAETDIRPITTSVPVSIELQEDSESILEDDTKEYLIITDEEAENDDEQDHNDHPQKTVSEILNDTTKSNPSNLRHAKCAICFDAPEHTYILPCGHVYCGDCVFRALSSAKNSTRTGGPCSLCRSYTTYKKVIPAVFKRKRKVVV